MNNFLLNPKGGICKETQLGFKQNSRNDIIREIKRRFEDLVLNGSSNR